MVKIGFKSKTLNILDCFISKIVDKPFLKKYDRICLICEEINNNTVILKEKAKKLLKIKNEKEKEKMVRIYDFLNELNGYCWLAKNGHKNIKFIKEIKNKKTPDFCSENKNKIFYTEVKTVRLGKDEENALNNSYLLKSGPSQTIEGNKNWKTGLKNKVESAIKNAELQFKSVTAGNKILLLFYIIGIDYSIYSCPKKPLNQVTLDDVLGKKFFKNFEEKKSIKIIRLPNC